MTAARAILLVTVLAVGTSLAAPATASGAEAIAIVSATGAGVAPAEIATALETLRVDLERTARFVAIPVASPVADGVEPSPAQAGAAARAAGTSLALVLRVTRLAAETWVRLAAFRPDGSVASVASASSAAGAPLDAALATVAASVPAPAAGAVPRPLDAPAGRAAPGDAPPPWNEARPPFATAPGPALPPEPRIDAIGFRAGAIFPRQRGTGDTRAPVFAGFGLTRWDDAGPIAIALSFDCYLSDIDDRAQRDRYVAVGAGVLLPIGRGPVAPYVGVELPYTWATFGGDGANGWAVRVPVGVVIDRFGPAPVRIEATWFVNGGRERDLVTGALYTQYGLTLSVAVSGAQRR